MIGRSLSDRRRSDLGSGDHPRLYETPPVPFLRPEQPVAPQLNDLQLLADDHLAVQEHRDCVAGLQSEGEARIGFAVWVCLGRQRRSHVLTALGADAYERYWERLPPYVEDVQHHAANDIVAAEPLVGDLHMDDQRRTGVYRVQQRHDRHEERGTTQKPFHGAHHIEAPERPPDG